MTEQVSITAISTRLRKIQTRTSRLSSLDGRTVAAMVVALLIVAGLLLPPVSLGGRLASLGYTPVPAARTTRIASEPPGVALSVSAQSARESTRARVRLLDGLPSGVDELPSGTEMIGPLVSLSIRRPQPASADLDIPTGLDEQDLAFVDPYGWDGERWRWLPVAFPQPGQARVRLPLDEFNPSLVALTRSGTGSTEVSAVLLPPPSVVPAAVAEIPILEMTSYHLSSPEGDLEGSEFPVPARPAGRYAVVDNLEGTRVRTDLIANVLSVPESRRRHRAELVEVVQKSRLAGLVLDYRGISGELQPVYADWLARLGRDLDKLDADLVVTVPMPRQQSGGWDSSPVSWSALASGVDAVRVLLPNDVPLDIESLDSLVRWGLRQVDRRKLQLGVPVQGRDLSPEGDTLVSFGAALARVLDMARADAPARLSPGEEALVELPTLREASLVRDPAYGMWRFFTWDDLRQQHTVWLNDALGLRPAFQIAARYRIGRLALHGIEAGLDPALWPMVRAFQRSGEARASEEDYQLSWKLMDGEGRVVREAQQPLNVSEFRFRAPDLEGGYELKVDLVTSNGSLVAPGPARHVTIGPPLPPPPTATPPVFFLDPTPESAATRPPPPDELSIDREPVRADVVTSGIAGMSTEQPSDAIVSMPEAVLRAGPGVQHEVVSSARQGELLALLGRSPNQRWYQVRMEATGVIGWIRDEFVDLNIDPATIPVVETDS